MDSNHRPHDYESYSCCERRRNAVELEQGCPGNRVDQWRGVSRGSSGVYAIVDAWWTSSAGHGRAIEITRAERERGDTSPVKRLADAIRLAGVMVTGVLSRRTVRPRGDEARRPLPGDELVASAKIRWTHGITIRARPGGDLAMAAPDGLSSRGLVQLRRPRQRRRCE